MDGWGGVGVSFSFLFMTDDRYLSMEKFRFVFF